MSFKATIPTFEKQILWSRTINVLSSINEHIRFTISSSKLIVWTINSTDTTLCKVGFSRQFFDTFEFKPHDIVFGEDGVQIVTDSRGVDHKLYSFQTNGIHLGIVAKKPEGDTIKKFTIVINNTTTCPDILANRLLVHVEMDSLICKQYSLQFEPIKYDPIIIDLKYKKKFLEVYGSSTTDEPLDPKLLDIFRDNEIDIKNALFDEEPKTINKKKDQLTAADEINYICCNQTLLKNFIDNCNANVTGELKLEINVSKLSLTAFTKAIRGKNYDILRNTMSFSNTISTLDLEHYCLFTTVEEESSDQNTNGKESPMETREQTKNIIFQLKEFKNFMSIASSCKSSSDTNISIWFCHRGDPIIFELKKPGVVLELVQVTVTTGINTIEEPSMSGSSKQKNIKKSTSPTKKKDSHEIGLSRLSPLKNMAPSRDLRLSPLKNFKTLSPKSEIKRRLFVPEDSSVDQNPSQGKKQKTWDSQSTAWNNDDDIPVHKAGNSSSHENEVGSKSAPAERNTTTIGWGTKIQERSNEDSKIDKISLLKKEKLKYFEELREEQRQKEDNQTNIEGLGPTQTIKPKGLFD